MWLLQGIKTLLSIKISQKQNQEYSMACRSCSNSTVPHNAVQLSKQTAICTCVAWRPKPKTATSCLHVQKTVHVLSLNYCSSAGPYWTALHDEHQRSYFSGSQTTVSICRTAVLYLSGPLQCAAARMSTAGASAQGRAQRPTS